MKRVLLTAAAAMALMAPATAQAAVITYGTPAGSQIGGEDIAARATFTTSAGAVTLLLENLIVDPNSVGQNISGISFTIAGSSGGSLTSSTGVPRTILANDTFTDGVAGATDWIFSFGGGNFSLTGLGASLPDQTIVGAPNAGTNEYDNANGSIAGNGPHNPFLALQATFAMSALGITDQSVVSNVILFFGTGPTAFTPTLVPNTPPPSVPEPTSMLLLGSGLAAIATRLRRRKSE